jgi:hypothetical protein
MSHPDKKENVPPADEAMGYQPYWILGTPLYFTFPPFHKKGPCTSVLFPSFYTPPRGLPQASIRQDFKKFFGSAHPTPTTELPPKGRTAESVSAYLASSYPKTTGLLKWLAPLRTVMRTVGVRKYD